MEPPITVQEALSQLSAALFSAALGLFEALGLLDPVNVAAAGTVVLVGLLTLTEVSFTFSKHNVCSTFRTRRRYCRCDYAAVVALRRCREGLSAAGSGFFFPLFLFFFSFLFSRTIV